VSRPASTVTETLQAAVEEVTRPNGWRRVRLGDVCDIVARQVDPKLPQYGSLPHINGENIISGLCRLAYLNTASEESMTSGKYLFEAGDVLYSKLRPYLRKAVVAEVNGVCSADMYPIKVNRAVLDPHFAAWLLVSDEFTNYADSESRRARMPKLNREQLFAFNVPLPPLNEQKRIVIRINDSMAAIELARAAAKAQLKASKDLPAAYIRAVFNSSEAMEWDKKRLGEVCEIVARQVDPKVPEYGALPHVNGENIESGLCRLKFLRTAADDNMISGKYLFEAGDVLYSKLRPYLRKAIVADFRGVCSADMYPIRVNPEFLNPHFAGWMLVSDEFTKYADEESRRARMPKLNREQLFAWEAPLPPLATQEFLIENLSERMAKAESLIVKLQDQFDSINTIPAALLRQAFSGKL
jgi:type I restriction enzyme S subunit